MYADCRLPTAAAQRGQGCSALRVGGRRWPGVPQNLTCRRCRYCALQCFHMTEPSTRQKPKRPPVAIADLSLLVKVPGHPDAIRSFTAAEAAEAQQYATETGGTIEHLN